MNDAQKCTKHFRAKCSSKHNFFSDTRKRFVTSSRIRHDHLYFVRLRLLFRCFFYEIQTDFCLSCRCCCCCYCIERRPHQIIVNDFRFIVRATVCVCVYVLIFFFVLFRYFVFFFVCVLLLLLLLLHSILK